MQEIMQFTGKSRNTIKKKFQAVPVRAAYVPNTRKKFYKIDWKALQLLRPRDRGLLCPAP